MKTIFKSLMAIALFVGIGSTAHAQGGLGATETVPVRARILKQITFAAEDTIRFGTVAAGSQTYLDPQVQSASTNIGFNARVGRVVIDATADEVLRVVFDETVAMSTGGGSPVFIDYQPKISAVRTLLPINDANRALSVLVSNQPIGDPEVDVTGPNGTGFGPECFVTTDDTDDRVTLFIGGSLFETGTTNPATTQGTFEGVLNFSVQYAI